MIKPLFDNILIEPEEAENKTASGIILPDQAKEKPEIGKVLAIGKGKRTEFKPNRPIFEPIEVSIGDRVLYKKWTGNEVKFEGKKFIIVSQENILAII